MIPELLQAINHCWWAVTGGTGSFTNIIIYIWIACYDTSRHEGSNGNPIQMRLRAYAFSASVIYCFQKPIPCSSLCVHAAAFVYRSYHVYVNHAIAMLLSVKRNKRESQREGDIIFFFFHLFSVSIHTSLCLTVIAASR